MHRQIGFGYYNKEDRMRKNLYIDNSNTAYFYYGINKYSFKLDDRQMYNIHKGFLLNITLTEQTLPEILRDKLQVYPIFYFYIGTLK